MADLARKMPESAHMTGFSSPRGDLANEKHYSVIEISKLWALSQKTVRRIFEREPGVIQWGSMETRHKRVRLPDFTCARNSPASCASKVATSKLKSADSYLFKRSSPAAAASAATSCHCVEGQSKPCAHWRPAALVEP